MKSGPGWGIWGPQQNMWILMPFPLEKHSVVVKSLRFSVFCVRCSEGRGNKATDGGELLFSEPFWAEWHSL